MRRAKLLSLFETLARGRQDFPLRGLDAAQVDWIVRSGLGPLCFHAAKELLENSSSPHWSSLKAADLTARMIGGEHLDAMREIIDASAGCVPRLTLLKGISVAAECYPEFHLRPMRDIDFLIPEEYLARMEDLLRSLGYKQTCGERPDFYRTHHHLMPFFHEEKRVWVEVHHHLLSTQNRASRDPVFGLSNVLGQLRRSRFQNREIYRLSTELQLVYLAAHWAQDFKSIGGMIAAMDLIYLLNHRGGRLRWDTLLGWIEGSAAATYLYLLVSYLERLQLLSLPDEILGRLSVRHGFGRLSLKAAHAMMDAYMLDGKDFGAALTRRNLSIAWNTLILPVPSPCKWLLMPLNLCVPGRLRVG